MLVTGVASRPTNNRRIVMKVSLLWLSYCEEMENFMCIGLRKSCSALDASKLRQASFDTEFRFWRHHFAFLEGQGPRCKAPDGSLFITDEKTMRWHAIVRTDLFHQAAEVLTMISCLMKRVTNYELQHQSHRRTPIRAPLPCSKYAKA